MNKYIQNIVIYYKENMNLIMDTIRKKSRIFFFTTFRFKLLSTQRRTLRECICFGMNRTDIYFASYEDSDYH